RRHSGHCGRRRRGGHLRRVGSRRCAARAGWKPAKHQPLEGALCAPGSGAGKRVVSWRRTRAPALIVRRSPWTAADALAGLSRSSKALALRTKERPRRTQSRGSAPRILRHYRYWEKYAALGRSACATKPAETKQYQRINSPNVYHLCAESISTYFLASPK